MLAVEDLAEASDCLFNRNIDARNTGELFSDGEAELKIIGPDHTETLQCVGRLSQYEDRILCGDRSFSLKDIDSMAMTRTHILLFSYGGEYYELSVEKGINLRKYLEIWKAQSE